MRLLLDESVDARLALFLTTLGHDVQTVVGDYRSSLPDADILAIAVHESRIVITNDRDFGDLVFRLNRSHAGVIYLRLRDTTLSYIETRLAAGLARYPDASRSFVVVTDRRVRVASPSTK